MDGKLTFQKVVRWTDEECRAYLEAMRWPDGARCPKCGADEPWTITRRTPSKNAVRTLYRCRACKRQFTSTVGTIFEDSKIPLSKWFAAIYLMCASKKGISAHQLHRQLDITYKSAWFMCHRIREAMRDKAPTLLTGVIEADETYVGGKPRGHRPQRFQRLPQLADGGSEGGQVGASRGDEIAVSHNILTNVADWFNDALTSWASHAPLVFCKDLRLPMPRSRRCRLTVRLHLGQLCSGDAFSHGVTSGKSLSPIQN